MAEEGSFCAGGVGTEGRACCLFRGLGGRYGSLRTLE